MASSSSPKRRRSYDVFLSFRGTDVRENFVGHLYAALDGVGINTYIDTEELQKGEEITPALMMAIEESQIAIVVFSENYACSSFRLDELTKIMECKKEKKLLVWPVFYKVEPREVRTPREIYKEAMAMQKAKLEKEKDPEKIKRWEKRIRRWEETLLAAGSLSGWHFPHGDHEAKLVQNIVQKISTQLDRMPLDVATNPVGIDSKVQELKTILDLQSKDDVFMVGLWGQGGVGKTTLAIAIYNAIFRNFEGSCFLERVRENSKNPNGLVLLQEQLLSQVLPRKNESRVFGVHGGSQLIKDRLLNKRVLIILDDVNDAGQLSALARSCDWFGKGSRIIVTTRNKSVLKSYEGDSDRMYKVKALKDDEALELFRKYAFPRNQEMEIPSNLVKSVLNYVGGLPLALKVLGSSLRGRGIQEWEETLQALAKGSREDINDVLKVSYEGLKSYAAKEIFLDIACFFKGRETKYIKKVLDSCGFQTENEVKILIESSLISKENGTLQMHDLMQSMGKDIVLEECRDDPGKRSRLWLQDDVFNVLSREKGTKHAKAIVLKLSQPEETYFSPKAFKKMMKLRLLILHNVQNSSADPIHLPNALMWFEWPHCASIPKFSHGPKELAGLDMRNSKIEVGLEQFKDFKKLKFINFSGCQSLICMPDLDCTPNLETLDLHGCKNLERAHESIAYHNKLQLLNLNGCSRLHHFPDVLQSKNLQLLKLNDCSKLQKLPDFSDKMKGLRGLHLSGTSIEKLPTSIENLVSLGEMNLGGCKKLAILPSSIYRMQNLEFLLLQGCSKLIKFPTEDDSSDSHKKTGFPKLQYLNLNGCNLSEVEFLENHSGFPYLYYLQLAGNNFTNLPSFVSYCQRIQEILNFPRQLERLSAIGCESLIKSPSNICDVDSIDLSGRLTFHNLLRLQDFYPFCGCRELFLPGGEMPEWLLPNNEGHISFMASKDLFEKFIGLAFCVVFRGKEGKDNVTLELTGNIHIESIWHFKVDLDHLWLQCYEPGRLWRRDAFGPNGWGHFGLTIRALRGGIVKKCGFRLICKPLENDLDVLLQHNHLLDPSLLYEVQHEYSKTSTVEESSSETEDLLDGKTSTEETSSSNLVVKRSTMADFSLQRMLKPEDSSNETEDLQDSQMSTEEDSSSKLIHRELNMADFSIEKLRYSQIPSYYRNVRPAGEMLEKFVLVEDGTISFMASRDLYGKFRGLVLCVVIGVQDGKKEISFDIMPHVNGKRRNVLSGTLGSFDSDRMWIQHLEPDVMWGLLEGGVDFSQFEESYLQFSLTLRVSGGTVKKLGYMIRSRQLEDDLKFALEDNQLVNPASLHEDSDESVYAKEDKPYRRRYFSTEYLGKCHII